MGGCAGKRERERSLGFARAKKNELSRARRGAERREGWKCTVENSPPPVLVPVRRNLSHKELPRVFIRRENLMRPAAPQLKRAANPRATCLRAGLALVVVVVVAELDAPDYLLSR